MVEQWTTTATKPSRSDDVLDPDQQLKIAEQVRAQFDSMAPKRPSKPNRSEPDLSSPTPLDHHAITIPELHKFQSLQQSQSQVVLSTEGAPAAAAEEEFVETEYYTELGSIDKQHHTTGTGFIKVMRDQEGEKGYGDLGPVGTVVPPVVTRSNPATNDWIPNMDADRIFITSKPNRSESESS
ncbi:uncharacterized protein LOC133812814 [Humulus lupulus]|uniref:uncharacterized protein LOC133812814 n=1 Tax=Humulus lupulus TaxID=3486 RepID=UPI002B412D0B|nr:uncharacterized protein LOC133812814 [Humulus lupulus]